jgi:hypothetical protein
MSVLGGFLRHQLSHNRLAQKVLLGCTLLMTAMVLGDGVLTPSISGQRCTLQADTHCGIMYGLAGLSVHA